MVHNPPHDHGRITLNRSIQIKRTPSAFNNEKSSSSSVSSPPTHLRLMMLGCEDNPPYGPNEHTAQLFLELISSAQQQLFSQNNNYPENCDEVSVSITIYKTRSLEYPSSQSEWDSYHGILIPGSFCSAHFKNREWIDVLKNKIRNEVHAKQRKTLAICFGHQVFAHAFEPDGLCVRCPKGSQTGRKYFGLTREGKALLLQQKLKKEDKKKNDGDTSHSTDEKKQNEEVHLLYTHGDIVKTLPTFAVSLGGSPIVPVQSAAYFETTQDALTYQNSFLSEKYLSSSSIPKPYALTFQAHLEYTSPTGFENTFPNVIHTMEKRGACPSEVLRESKEDACRHFDLVRETSLEIMMAVGRTLGWM